MGYPTVGLEYGCLLGPDNTVVFWDQSIWLSSGTGLQFCIMCLVLKEPNFPSSLDGRENLDE